VEVVSPESADRDWLRKFSAYERAGVKEYWLIDPLARRLEANHLEGRHYQPLALCDGRLESKVLPGFYLMEQWLFTAKRPLVLQIAKELGVAV
jgi:Uma2 family endonuclease